MKGQSKTNPNNNGDDNSKYQISAILLCFRLKSFFLHYKKRFLAYCDCFPGGWEV